jgi:hypothetical protein
MMFLEECCYGLKEDLALQYVKTADVLLHDIAFPAIFYARIPDRQPATP